VQDPKTRRLKYLFQQTEIFQHFMKGGPATVGKAAMKGKGRGAGRRKEEVLSQALTQSSLDDAKSSLGDAESSLGDAKSSLGDAESSLGDAKSSLGDAKSSLGDAKSSLGDDAKSSLGDA
jgi:hypothetical protein